MSATASETLSLRPMLLLLALGLGVILAGTVALWAYFGTAVFFETIRAGWAACF